MNDAELERHRDELRAELARIREETEQHRRAAGGAEAQRLQAQVDALVTEVAALQDRADVLAEQLVEREDELEERRRETAAARRHLADLWKDQG